MALLTEALRAAIDHPAERLHILACAGSGKTEVLSRRAVRLLADGADPASLIAFTFTEKAASELKARIEQRAQEADPSFQLLPPVARGMFIGTTHGWALRMLQEAGGLYETMDALTEEQEWALLQRVARRLGVVDLYAASEGNPSGKVAIAPAVQSFLRSAEVVHNEYLSRTVLQQEAPAFAGILERYEWLLAEMRLVPFRLMIRQAVEALDEGGLLHQRLKGRIRHVLVDECQDFNRTQNELLQRLIDLGATVTVVGDDDQAIYQWRGGDLSLFTQFPERLEGTRRVTLGANHRCRPEIVAFAAHLIDKLGDRTEKELTASRPPTEQGAVEILIGKTPRDEADQIGNRVQGLIKDGHQPADMAVLYRSVRTSAAPLVRALQDRSIPAAVVGKTSLMAQDEMALIARIFVWWAGGTWYPFHEPEPECVTPDRLTSEIRLVTGSDKRRVSRMLASLERLGGRIRAEGVHDSVALFNEMLVVLGLPTEGQHSARQERRLGRMSELLTDFDGAARRAIPKSFYEEAKGAARAEAAEDMLLAQEPETGDKTEETPRVLGLTRGEVYLVRLRSFLEAFAGRAAEETPDEAQHAGDAVQIMTVHQSKGLQFPVVFVPCLVEKRFPSALMGRTQHWYVPEHLFDRERYEGRENDEARLLYVALTRARELLVVSWFQRHTSKSAEASRFLRRHLRDALKEAVSSGQAQPEMVPRRDESELLDLDFSSLVTFQECGYRYWLRHVCGFRPFRVPELGFGKLLHHVVAELARMAAGGDTPGPIEVDRILDRSFYLPFAGPVPAERLREAAGRRLKTYVRNHGAELNRTIQPEYRFEVPLAHARVRGRIDLLLRAKGGDSDEVELIDFKTSENRPPSELHKNQLRLYAAAVKTSGRRPVRLSIHDLDAETGQRYEIPFDDKERSAFEKRLEGWAAEIAGGIFQPVKDVTACDRCDFRSFCLHGPERRPG
jgi:DNA helicase-2/ATP-dependent DNA helicase PcrA